MGPPEGPAARLVREFDAGAVIPPGDAEGLQAALIEHYRKWRDGGVPSRPVSEKLKQYERSHLTRLLARELDEVLADRKTGGGSA